MKFCPVCRHCYDNHVTICKEHGSPLKAWPQSKYATNDNWVSGSCQLTHRYRLVRVISTGGMGTVFEGIDKNLNQRPVAVKILHRHAHLTDPAALYRFRREAHSASRISHQNLAVIHDYGVSRAWGTFIVMELIRGENLARHLKAVGCLPVPVACQIAQQISHGIGELHHSGFVHRDLKPSNVIITHYADGLVLIKVVDFGIIKAIEPIAGDDPTPTNPGLYVGTPHYMSPEHCANKRLDARSDIYSLGILLFEVLTGKKPFNCKRGEEVVLLSKHLSEQPPLLRQFKADLPEALELLIDKALRKEPSERPQSAYDFARALREFTQLNGESPETIMQSPSESFATAEPETQTVLSDGVRLGTAEQIAMFIRGWSRQQKRTVLASIFVTIIGIIGALGSWMNVPEFRQVAGLDPTPQLPVSPVTKASPARNPRSSNRAAQSPPELKHDTIKIRRETAGQARKLHNVKPIDSTVQSASREKHVEIPLSGNAFNINSIGDKRFGIGAALEGVLRIKPDSIEVEIPNPLLRLHSSATHSGPRELQSVQAGVGRFNHSEPWRSRLSSSSQLVQVGRTLSPGEEVTLKPLKFIIPKKGLADLSALELIILIDNKAVATGVDGNKTRAYAYSKL